MKNLKIVFLILALAWPIVAPAENPSNLNWAVNGDFKTTQGWTGNLVTKPGREGGSSAYIENTQPNWTEYDEKVMLPSQLPPVIEISGWIKTENVVKGQKDWEMARIAVVFYDAAGKRVGDWPPVVGQVQGTTDWTYYSNRYRVPAGTAWLTLEVALGNCTGRGWFSDIQMAAYDYDDKPLAAGESAHPGLKPKGETVSDNWIPDPGFESPSLSVWNQAQITGPGHNSLHCISSTNDAPSWNLASFDVDLQGKKPTFVVYGGWVKTQKVVRGGHEWEAARLGIDFRDSDKKQLGGWQDSVCKVVGDTDWTYYEKKYQVPAGCAQVHLDAGLGNCTGKAWFDDLSLTLLDDQGKTITADLRTEQATDTSDWYPFQSPTKMSDVPLDLSFLIEKPAGLHGFVQASKGHFHFADGTRIKFWGTDIVGPRIFISHEEADATAERMAKLGINLVRLHFLDNDWGSVSLFDPKADNTQTFLPDSLEKLEYLISALKKNGIYVYPDWSVGRRFRAGDGVPGYQDLEDGAKTVIHFSRKIIELNKKYAKMLLTHVNPYTGLALKDDPVYVGNEIVNESSIFCGFGEQKFPQPFWDELQKMYAASGGKGSITHFKFDWDTQRLMPTENPENAEASLKFLLREEIKSNLEMKAFLKKLSPHALLTGSNMGLPVLGDIYADSKMDFMDTHAYWDHPQIWNIDGGWNNVQYAPMNNNSQLRSPFAGSLLFNLSHAAVEGKALIITEWNDCVPNEYRIEGPLLMAAYGDLQNWDGFLQFDYGPALIGSENMTNFSINSRPDNEPLYEAGALIFREGLLKPSEVTVVEPIADKDILANGSHSDWLFNNAWLPYVAKVVKRFTGKKEGTPADLTGLEKDHDATTEILRSSTGEETLDYGKGVLKLDAPTAQGFLGTIGTGDAIQTTDISMAVSKRNPWAAVLAVSLDKQPLAQSKQFAVFAVAHAENSGQVYNASRTALKDAGQTPVLMQGVEAGITLRVSGASYTVSPLDESGNKGKPVKAVVENGFLKFSISPTDHTAYYLVETAQP